MQQINDFLNYFKNMNEEKIVDILMAIVIITVFCMLSSRFSYSILRIFYRNKRDREEIKHSAFYNSIRILFIFIGMYIGIYIIQFPETVMAIWRKVFKILVIWLIAKGLINIVDPKSEIAKKWREKDDNNKNVTVANFTGRILKYTIYLFFGFFIITELGYDITGLVAGLGIGATVVALAAQDFVKSLISGFSILSDKPFLVGDWIEVGTDQGTVIDITFRCTKIRTPNNTLVTLPNSTVTATSIINWSRLEQRRYSMNLKLPLETNSDVIETIVNRIKFVLEANEDVVPESVQVHFDTIDQTGNNIIIYLYTTVIEYANYLHFRQVVNNQILKVLESENIKLAYPGQNIYVMNKEEN